MSNLINFSATCDFVELENRIKMLYSIDDYHDRLTKTVELLEEISRNTATDSAVYHLKLSEQLSALGDAMAVYVMAKVWEARIYGLRDVQSKTPELIDTDELGNSFYRHPIDAEEVKWLIEYEQNNWQ